MIRVGIVVQRYGKDIVGGAETLARDVAERLNAAGCSVTVFTTAAKDYITWKNEFKTGESILKGVLIKRFPVESERNIEAFNEYSGAFFASDASPDRDEEEWIRMQGPYSPELIQGLIEAEKEIDIFLFFTYLYYPTVAGLKAIRKPAVLFPTAHNEAPIYLNCMKEVFNRPQALCFLTGAEMGLVTRLFSPSNVCELLRTGIDIREDIDEALFRRKYYQLAPYFCYAGRIEKGKGLEPVLEAFEQIRRNCLVEFVLMGKKLMDLPKIGGLKYVGFVSEEEKLSAFRGALFSVQPSPMESLSITTLESFSQRRPVLVNQKCAVLCEHIELSRGGLSYDSVDEFVRHCRHFCEVPRSAAVMGLNGYSYVTRFYSWEKVISTLRNLLERLVK